MVFTPILLLNMLIAMMGNTYCEVIEQSEKEWVKQWANIIVALEKAIDCKSAKEFLQTYSIKMPSSDKETEVRGVIVIKAKPKSKAKEKKQALSLWKRVGKRTIQELRKFGGKAAEVRKRYNLFRSKQPTARLRMGKVVQEWNPTPTPVYLDTSASENTNGDANMNNVGFNDLLSQVTFASGMDIEEKMKPKDIVTKPAECNSNTLDKKISENLITCSEQKVDFTQQNGKLNSVSTEIPQSKLEILQISKTPAEMKNRNECNLETENCRWNGMENIQIQPTKDKGISVSIQTTIRSTKINKSKIRRRKDLVFPLRNGDSNSSSEKEAKTGYLLYRKKSNRTGCNFRIGNKYKRKRRNQITFQEKISVDNVQYDIPD